MAKKRRSKRQVKRSTSRTAKSSLNRSGEREFNPDYTYVKKDLRRIGTLAGTFFVVLVVLSFFL